MTALNEMESLTRRRRLIDLFAMNTGSWLVIVAALLFACKGTLIKYIYSLGASVADVMILRLLFSLPIYLWVALHSMRHSRPTLQPKHWLGIALCGVLGYYVSSYLDMLGLEHVSVGLERVILYTYPAFVVLFSTLLLRKSISRALCFYIAFIYCGLLLVFYADLHGKPSTSIGDITKGSLFVLGAAMVFATYVIGSEHYMRMISSSLFTALMMIAAGVAMTLHYTLFESFAHLAQLPAHIYWWCAFTAAVFTVLPAFMMSAGVRKVGAATAGALGMIGPIATMGIAAAFLGESLSAMQVIGLAIVMTGVYRVHSRRL
ncbi:MAG: DMT family transporter [Spongiibacteraceae bacterium]